MLLNYKEREISCKSLPIILNVDNYFELKEKLSGQILSSIAQYNESFLSIVYSIDC